MFLKKLHNNNILLFKLKGNENFEERFLIEIKIDYIRIHIHIH